MKIQTNGPFPPRDAVVVGTNPDGRRVFDDGGPLLVEGIDCEVLPEVSAERAAGVTPGRVTVGTRMTDLTAAQIEALPEGTIVWDVTLRHMPTLRVCKAGDGWRWLDKEDRVTQFSYMLAGESGWDTLDVIFSIPGGAK